MQIAILNGVNLDVLERRDPEIYGGLSARCRQTNNEGEYVAWCHDALDWAGGVIVNPGAWTHYSYAIRDALELVKVPIVEVHLSNLDEREEWRRHSVIAELASRRILGKGPAGYRDALTYLVEGT